MNERTRVVCLLDSLVEIGGAETLAVEMIIRLDPDRFDRILVLTRWSDEVAAAEPALGVLRRLREAGVRVVGLRRTRRLAIRPWLSLLRLLRRERTQVLHAHKFGSNLWGVIFGRLARVPVVIAHEHMWSYEGGSARSVIDRELIARFSDAFIAVSRAGLDQMIEGQGIRPADLRLIPNGVPELPGGDGARVRAELGIAPGDPVVGTLANLRPEKALELLVAAAAPLAERFDGLRVLIAGEGDERDRLESEIARLGLGETVSLLGYRTDVADLVDAFDVAVCCSDYEGGPLSVMEYLESATPVVATRVGGLPELLGERAAVYVPARDAGELAAAIGALLAEPERRELIADAARERRGELGGIQDWVERIAALYDELLAAKRSHTRE